MATSLLSAPSSVSGGWGVFLTRLLVSEHPEGTLPNVGTQ